MDDDLIGLSVTEAKAVLAKRDMILRVVKRDGRPCIGTRDVRPNRVNVIVDNNVIVGTTGRG
jgi:hypothetical protein